MTRITLTGTSPERHTVSGLSAKSVAELIAAASKQDAIWTGKVIGEWHITDRRTRKVSAIVYTA